MSQFYSSDVQLIGVLPSVISASSEHPGLICFLKDWLDLFAAKVLSIVFSNTTVHKHQIFCAQLSL